MDREAGVNGQDEPSYFYKGENWNDYAQTVTDSNTSYASLKSMAIGFRCAK